MALRGNYIFIRHEHNVGVGKESGKAYDFATISLSDGVESFDADLDQQVIPQLAGLRKGDSVNIEIEPQIRFKKTVFKVVQVSPAKVTEKVS